MEDGECFLGGSRFSAHNQQTTFAATRSEHLPHPSCEGNNDVPRVGLVIIVQYFSFSIFNRTFRFLVWKTDTVPWFTECGQKQSSFLSERFVEVPELSLWSLVVLHRDHPWYDADKMCFYIHWRRRVGCYDRDNYYKHPKLRCYYPEFCYIT